MSADPDLIIQMQRMGDLILVFPLCLHLHALEPDRPLWIVAEPIFFSELLALAPDAVFFSPDMASQLQTATYHMVINFSHREEALDLAGSLQAEKRIGAFRKNGILHIEGAWQLYRYSLIGNNRHNRFHWADMETLGIVPADNLLYTRWPVPSRPLLDTQWKNNRVGLFVGASEDAKRPNAQFWGELARMLCRRGLRPVILGGPDDQKLAAEAVRQSGLPQTANLAGQFQLADLAVCMQSLDLVITPDTGPMHLAAWVGAPVLNLSMGPVNAWETAPAPPGHLVIRPIFSCTGCWSCSRAAAFCRDAFQPGDIAGLVLALAEGKNPAMLYRRPAGLSLSLTRRDSRGLFILKSIQWGKKPLPTNQREKLDIFWQECFLAWLGGAADNLESAAGELFAISPQLLKPMRKAAAQLARGLGIGIRKKSLASDFWCSIVPLLRPLSSYLLCLLQNDDFSDKAWRNVMNFAENFVKILEKIRD